MDEKKRKKSETDTRLRMEQLAHHLRELIISQPPTDLLGYIYGQRILDLMRDEKLELNAEEHQESSELIDDTQFVLEYVHAVLSSTEEGTSDVLNEAVCAEIFETAKKLKFSAMEHCMFSSDDTKNSIFGPKTAEVEFMAKSNWILLRGNRYPVLEEEFFSFVLESHDDALRGVYGIGVKEIASGFQSMANTIRTGHMRAVDQIDEQMEAVRAFASERRLDFSEAGALWVKERPEQMSASVHAYDDMLRGGICNLSKHTGLPALFLDDLSFHRGEETDFFAPGPYSGTPFRTLPARKKPLIKLGEDYFATDPCFARDSGYRALLWNLLRRIPNYRKDFEERQKQMSESAFFRVLSDQLAGAKVMQEIWYKDPVTRQWVENDTLIRLDDVLILVEAKAGAAATIASPALDFARHVQSVQDLVIKAYNQCRRFFDYLKSAEEMPLYRREAGKYVEVDHIRLQDYRVAIPVGLTVESFSPFSAMCKELPEIEPILGRYPFISLSIDDLLVLTRFLPTGGQLLHYLEVRQAVAGLKKARLFDELDHLGAYISGNRFDETIKEQLSKGVDLMLWDGMSKIVDQHFEGENLHLRPTAKQEFPKEVESLLEALNGTKAPGWLAAESYIRNYGKDERSTLAFSLKQRRESLTDHISRYFCTNSLFVWLQRGGYCPRSNSIARESNISGNSGRFIK